MTLSMPKKRSGNVMVILAVGALLFLGLLAMVIDVGLWYSERSQLQTLTDFCSIETLERFPANPKSKEAQSFVAKVFRLNGLSPQIIEVSSPKEDSVVIVCRLRLRKTFSAVFLKNPVQLKVTSRAERSELGQILLIP